MPSNHTIPYFHVVNTAIPYHTTYHTCRSSMYVRYLDVLLFKYEGVWHDIKISNSFVGEKRETTPYLSLQTTSIRPDWVLWRELGFNQSTSDLGGCPLWILDSTFNPRWQHLCRTVRSVRTGISDTYCHTYHSIPCFKIAIQWQA